MYYIVYYHTFELSICGATEYASYCMDIALQAGVTRDGAKITQKLATLLIDDLKKRLELKSLPEQFGHFTQCPSST